MENEYFARTSLRDPNYHPLRIAGRAIQRAAADHLKGRLLEIGCGNKAKALLIGPQVGLHVGLDHSASAHGRANVDLFGDAHALPARDESFDGVLSTAVLEHLEDPGAALREAWRVLEPGGIALYTLPLFWPLHEEPRDFYRYTIYGAQHLFEAAGFEVITLRPLSGFGVTATALCGKYLQQFRRGALRPVVDAIVCAMNLVGPLLDRGRLRDERYSWMVLVVARKKCTPQTSTS